MNGRLRGSGRKGRCVFFVSDVYFIKWLGENPSCFHFFFFLFKYHRGVSLPKFFYSCSLFEEPFDRLFFYHQRIGRTSIGCNVSEPTIRCWKLLKFNQNLTLILISIPIYFYENPREGRRWGFRRDKGRRIPFSM